ncbi:hypothetical protein LPJ61_002829 [Coemansia biformis]|uniref:Uncharacterized protein n=1 Tax=Coemansia biformis TaxID=1286918 RepID=A0A9W8CYT3_9FUNG|nr:hypothetical protein LPJ61_002829 [Coemansia biformis]
MLYADIELQRAKDIVETCDTVSPGTKGCYSSRIVTWIHFCNTCCSGDDLITEQRLADYVEWLASSGAVDHISQGRTRIQQVVDVSSRISQQSGSRHVAFPH